MKFGDAGGLSTLVYLKPIFIFNRRLGGGLVFVVFQGVGGGGGGGGCYPMSAVVRRRSLRLAVVLLCEASLSTVTAPLDVRRRQHGGRCWPRSVAFGCLPRDGQTRESKACAMLYIPRLPVLIDEI